MLVSYKSKVLPTDWNKQSIVNCFRLFLLYKMLNYIIHYTKLLLVPLYFQRKHLMLRFYPLFDCLVLCVINLKIFPIMIDDFVIEWKFYFSLPSTRIYILFSNMTNSHFESKVFSHQSAINNWWQLLLPTYYIISVTKCNWFK